MSGYLKRFLVGGLTLSIVNVSQKIIGFVLLPVFTFYLSPKDFGFIAIYSLISSFLSLLYNPGIISSTERLYFDFEPESDELKTHIGSSWWFLIIVPIIIIIISIFFGEKVSKILFGEFEFWPIGFLAVISALFTQPIRLWSSVWICRNKMKSLVLWSFLKLVIGVSVSLFFVVIIKHGAIGRIYGLMSGNIILFFVAFYNIVKFSGFHFSFVKVKHTLMLGFPLILSVFSYVILDISDRYLIEKIIGLADLGLYDIAYTISGAPLLLMIGFSDVWQPIFYENLKNEIYKDISHLLNLFIIGLIFVCATVIVFSNEIFNLLINKDYINVIEFIPWIVGGIYFLGLSGFLNSILGYNKKFLEIGIFALVAAILNIVLNLFLIKAWGISGAAISTFISYLVYFLILYIRTFKTSVQIFNLNKLTFPNICMILIIIVFLFINMMFKELNIAALIIKLLFFIGMAGLLLNSNFLDRSTKEGFSSLIKKYLFIRIPKSK